MNMDIVKRMMVTVCDSLVSREHELCRLDSFIGDGDHGVTVVRGFSAAKEALAACGFDCLKDLFEAMGNALSGTMGGAIGPIYGCIFSGGADSLAGVDELDTAGMAALFSGGLESVMFIGNAKEGDRTLVDALAPAARSLEDSARLGLTPSQALAEAAKAADEGMKSTAEMVARIGRARFLGEKSKGYIDAGAASFTYVIKSMAEFAANL